MRLTSLTTLLALSSAALFGQFEQKLSLNLSGGVFNTVGSAGYEPDYVTNVNEPTLMPNFKTGYSLSGGLQYNLNRHFSVEASLGVMISSGWYYDYSPPTEPPFNYLYYEIETSKGSSIIEFKGENDLDLKTLCFAVAPRYYILHGKKLNPYLFAGFNITYLEVLYQDHEYEAYKERGRLDEYELQPASYWYDNSINLGLLAGTGTEYGLSDNLGIFLQFRYHFALLNDEDFYESQKFADFHTISLYLGMRLSFLKSKEL